MTGVHRHPRCCQREPARCQAAAQTQSVSAIKDAATTAAFMPAWSPFSRHQVSRGRRRVVTESEREETTLAFDLCERVGHSKTALSGSQCVLLYKMYFSKQYDYWFGLSVLSSTGLVGAT